MQITVETVTSVERKMTVSIPSESIEKEISQHIQKIMPDVRINGFRPGKVPRQVVQEQLGDKIHQDALNKLMKESLFSALEKENLNPLDMPTVQIHSDTDFHTKGQDFNYTAVFEVLPEVILKDWSDLVIEKRTAEILPEDIEQTLQGMQKQKTSWVETTAPAKEGDKVWIDFEGSIDNIPFEGGKAEDKPIILGSKSLISGFEEGLIGMQPEQECTLELTFPEEYHAKELAGKLSQFKVRVRKIESPVLPEFNDEFAKAFDISEGGMEKLREEVKKTLTTQLALQLKHQLKIEILSKITALYKHLETPKFLVQKESERLRDQMFAQMKKFDRDNNINLKKLDTAMFVDHARDQVILGLVMRAMTKQHNIEPEAAQIRRLIEEIADQYNEPEKVIQAYYHDENQLANIRALAIEEQIIDRILTEATVVEKPVKASEILNTAGGV